MILVRYSCGGKDRSYPLGDPVISDRPDNNLDLEHNR